MKKWRNEVTFPRTWFATLDFKSIWLLCVLSDERYFHFYKERNLHSSSIFVALFYCILLLTKWGNRFDCHWEGLLPVTLSRHLNNFNNRCHFWHYAVVCTIFRYFGIIGTFLVFFSLIVVAICCVLLTKDVNNFYFRSACTACAGMFCH